jgi:hypothetical protein
MGCLVLLKRSGQEASITIIARFSTKPFEVELSAQMEVISASLSMTPFLS